MSVTTPSAEEATFTVFVRLPNSKTACLEARGSDTVGYVCSLGLDRGGAHQLSITQVYISCGGKPVSPHTTLAAAGIGALSTLRLQPNSAAIQSQPSLSDAVHLLMRLKDKCTATPQQLCAAGLPEPDVEELELAMRTGLKTIEAAGRLDVHGLRQLPGVMSVCQALLQLCRMPESSSPNCSMAAAYGQKWYTQCILVLRAAYAAALRSIPQQLDAARLCLEVLLGCLSPLFCLDMRQAPHPSGRWNQLVAWGVHELCAIRRATEAALADHYDGPCKLEAALTLVAPLDMHTVRILEQAADNVDAALSGADLQTVAGVSRVRGSKETAEASCRALMELAAAQAYLIALALEVQAGRAAWEAARRLGYSAIHAALERLCGALITAMASTCSAFGGSDAADAAELQQLAQSVLKEAAPWLVLLLSAMHKCLLSSITWLESGQVRPGWDALRKELLAVLCQPLMQAALLDPHGCMLLADSVMFDAPFSDHVPASAKLRHLRRWADAGATGDGEEIHVSRDELVESSYAELLPLQPPQLNSHLQVCFIDEPGYGAGVTREWLALLVPQLFSPNLGLFARCGGNPLAILPSPTSSIQPNHLEYFRVAGRVMGLALLHEVPLGFQLASAFHKGLEILFEFSGDGDLLPPGNWCRLELEDLKEVDPQLWRSYSAVLEADDVGSMGLSFSITCDFLGAAVDVPLGSSPAQEVTAANREQYIDAALRYLLWTRICREVAAFSKGLADVSKRKCVARLFSRDTLNALITGSAGQLPVEEWRRHTLCAGWGSWCGPVQQDGTAVGGEGPEEPQFLRWFWWLLGAMSHEQRQALLRFWTSLPCLPPGGFAALPRKLKVVRADPTSQRHPQARTCFMELLLPEYPDVLQLAAGLQEALVHCEGFGMA